MSEFRIGVIGGSGLYAMEGLVVREERRLETPWGEPSDAYILGELDGRPVAFLARHGRGHRLLPTELNFRANVYGFKKLGVEFLISVSAVGSMKIEYAPGEIVVPHQFFDRTRHRPDTFFGNGLVAHVSLAHPVSSALAGVLYDWAKSEGATVHRGGTYLNMEGPQFSTKAESMVYRQWGMDVRKSCCCPRTSSTRSTCSGTSCRTCRPVEAIEFLLERMKRTKTNQEFFATMAQG